MALVFFGFFWFFLVFFGIGFGQNSKLETGFFLVFFGFFGIFWFFLVFLGIDLGQHSKLETGFLGSVGFFWFFLVFFGIFWFFLVFKFRVRISSQKKPKKAKKNQKNQKKPKKPKKKPKKTSRYTKIGILAWFFLVFFGFFWGEHPPIKTSNIMMIF